MKNKILKGISLITLSLLLSGYKCKKDFPGKNLVFDRGHGEYTFYWNDVEHKCQLNPNEDPGRGGTYLCGDKKVNFNRGLYYEPETVSDKTGKRWDIKFDYDRSGSEQSCSRSIDSNYFLETEVTTFEGSLLIPKEYNPPRIIYKIKYKRYFKEVVPLF